MLLFALLINYLITFLIRSVISYVNLLYVFVGLFVCLSYFFHFYDKRFEPNERLGSEETGGMNKLKEHPFFALHSYNTKWGELLDQRSPLEVKGKLNS